MQCSYGECSLQRKQRDQQSLLDRVLAGPKLSLKLTLAYRLTSVLLPDFMWTDLRGFVSRSVNGGGGHSVLGLREGSVNAISWLSGELFVM